MKKLIIIMFAVLVILVPFSVSAEEVSQNSGITAVTLNEGVYNIEVKSSSSMFRIVNCELNVSNDEMSAVITLSGKGYEKLFMGTGEEAEASPDNNCIYFTEDEEGMYTYTVPVEALDKEINCAAWSIRKQKWYDRQLVFCSDTLPEEAFAKTFNILTVIVPAAAIVLVIAIAAAAAVLIKRRRDKA